MRGWLRCEAGMIWEAEMNRRRFLSTTVLSGAALAGLASHANAFSERVCDAASADPACRELIRHHQILAQLETSLAERGLDDAQRKAILATAVCPFCGQPLIG
jgi:hypothetical protein